MNNPPTRYGRAALGVLTFWGIVAGAVFYPHETVMFLVGMAVLVASVVIYLVLIELW